MTDLLREPLVQRYFDGLKAGILLAVQCRSCADVTFPPAPHCRSCASADVEWRQLSGDGELVLLMCLATRPNRRFADFGHPSFIGSVRFVEGGGFTAHVLGLDGATVDTMDDEIARLPRPVRAVVIDIGGQKTVAFEVVLGHADPSR